MRCLGCNYRKERMQCIIYHNVVFFYDKEKEDGYKDKKVIVL